MAISLRGALTATARTESTTSVSLNVVLETFRIPRPIALREVVQGLAPIVLQFPLDDATCSGFCRVVVSHDGKVNYSGHVHNSGALDARYIAITSIPTAPLPVLIAHQSTAGGTFGLDPRDDDWDQEGFSRLAAGNWWPFRSAASRARTDFGASTGAFEVVSSLFGAGTGEFIFSL